MAKPLKSFRSLTEDVVPFPTNRWVQPKVAPQPPAAVVAQPATQPDVPSSSPEHQYLESQRKKILALKKNNVIDRDWQLHLPQLKDLLAKANLILLLGKRLYQEDQYDKGKLDFSWAVGLSKEEVINRLSEVNNPTFKLKLGRKFVNIDSTEGSGYLMLAMTDIPEKWTLTGDLKTIKAYGVPNYRWDMPNIMTLTPLAFAQLLGSRSSVIQHPKFIEAAARELGLH